MTARGARWEFDTYGEAMTLKTTKRDELVNELRRKIIGGTLERGTHLRQDELARQFDASITPVREALRLLEADGLVVAEPHRGVRVASIELEQLTTTYIMRRLIESHVIQRATIRLSRRVLSQAAALLETPPEDTVAAREQNYQFHFTLYQQCGQPALVARIESLWQAFPWDLMLDTKKRRDASHQEHQELLDALDHGDAERAADVTAQHIRNGYLAIRQLLTGQEGADPFEIDVD